MKITFQIILLRYLPKVKHKNDKVHFCFSNIRNSISFTCTSNICRFVGLCHVRSVTQLNKIKENYERPN